MQIRAITDLEKYLRRQPRAVLLFSGGLDSSLLLAVASRVLGPGLLALTMSGPHIVPGELAAAWALARRLGVRYLIREFDPLKLPEFRGNTLKRCYACKKAIIAEAREIAGTWGAATILDGTNLSDLEDFRPGLQAAREMGVQSPMLEVGLTKAAIRDLSRRLGLPWQKPAQSCLATRFPPHTPLTREGLARVALGEAWLRRRGFTRVRLRVKGDLVRLELPPEEWDAFLRSRVRGPFAALVAGLGWRRLELGLMGEQGQGAPASSPTL